VVVELTAGGIHHFVGEDRLLDTIVEEVLYGDRNAIVENETGRSPADTKSDLHGFQRDKQVIAFDRFPPGEKFERGNPALVSQLPRARYCLVLL
jgi:hypothetical protein